MATFTMSVIDKPSKSTNPYVLSDNETNCIHTKVIRVIVPAGESRHVTVIGSGTGTNVIYDADETITTDTDYTLEIDGYINPTDNSQNTEYATVSMFVRLVDGGSVYYSTQISRTHSGVIC